MSHLLQMRGLKQGAAYAKTLAETSHLLQMRGLKLFRLLMLLALLVASFTDAWIETNWHSDAYTTALVASFTDAWIETP